MMINHIEYIEFGFDENNMMEVEKLILEKISLKMLQNKKLI